VTNREKAVKRVLRLVEGYLATLPQDTLAAYDGGMMTWGELRKHVEAALKLFPLHPKGDAPT
jgi:hypothetical protein